MWFRVTSLAADALLFISLIMASTCVCGSTPSGDVRGALEQMYHWVDQGPHGRPWREYLQSELLEAQLTLGAKADPDVVAQVLNQYESGAPGLDLPQFADVRNAIERWLAELSNSSPHNLAAIAREAKSSFVPLTKADLDAARSRLRDAAARLDARLTAAATRGQEWREYLRWNALQVELSRGAGPDLASLEEIYGNFDSGYEGLQLCWFADVRRALRGYYTVAAAMREPQLKSQHAAVLDALAGQLESVRRIPTAEQAAGIADSLQWLRDTRQNDLLIKAVRRRFAHPNLFAEFSADLVATGIARPVDDVSPVDDVILGTQIRGTGRTTGQVTVRLVPCDRHGELEVVLHGTSTSDAVGYNGPAQVYTDGTTTLHARKRLFIDAGGVRTEPSTAEADTQTTITRIDLTRGGRTVEKVAWKRACRQKGEAEQIAASHAEDRVTQRVDEQIGQVVRQSNAGYEAKYRRPLIERELFPRQVRTGTTQDTLRVEALQADEGQLAAPVAPPPMTGRFDMALRVHESMVNNSTARVYSGLILTEEQFKTSITEILGKLPEQFAKQPQGEPWTISFAYGQPIFVAFAEGKFTVRVRGRSYATGEAEYPAMDVTAQYEIRKTDQGPKAIRLGDLQVVPPEFDPAGGQRLSGREQVIRDMLKKRFDKIFPPELVPQPLTLPGEWAKAGKLALSHWETRDGWMVLGWNRMAPVGVPREPGVKASAASARSTHE
jgi:hypothetical protein